jgi:hypothetical protein
MPRAILTFPKVEVTLDVPPDFVAYVTIENLRTMAESILSAGHTGIGIDTICRVRKDDKTHEWTEAFVNIEEEDTPDLRIEDDGFTQVEHEIEANTEGTLRLGAEYRRIGHDPEGVTILGPCTPDEAKERIRMLFPQLEQLWKGSKS